MPVAGRAEVESGVVAEAGLRPGVPCNGEAIRESRPLQEPPATAEALRGSYLQTKCIYEKLYISNWRFKIIRH